MRIKLSRYIKKLCMLCLRMVIYSAILFGIAAVIIGLRQERTSVLGYSFFYILSYSMEPVYPKDSLIAIRETDPDQIKIGDDITFWENTDKLVTHRVVDILENYDGLGMRGFQTKGINNSYIDEEIVYGGNIMGVVVYSAPWFGSLSNYVRQNVWLCCGLGMVLLIFVYTVKRLFLKNEEPVSQDEGQEKNSTR